MGGRRADTSAPEVFQPADPARTMPKWLVLGAILAVIAIALLFSWFQNRSLTGPDEVAAVEAEPTPAAAAAQQQPSQPVAAGPVVVSATEPSWVQVSDSGRTLFQGELVPGRPYQVPATASAPMLRAGKPEALRITVGQAVAPPIGPPGRVAANVSLLGPDLMDNGAQAGNAAPAPAASQ